MGDREEYTNMNTLLVWPRIPVTYWGAQYSVGLVGKRAAMPPLSVLTVAALCPRDWNMRVVDLNIEELSRSDIEWADLVFVSGMAIQHQSTVEILSRCKQAGVTTVVGGPHATSSPERLEDATHLLLDEAEITLPKFLHDLAEGNPQRIYRADGQKPDVTRTPPPRFDLLKMSAYANMCIQFSRGCPFACEFCDITTLYGKNPRTKTPEQIVGEVQALYDAGFRGEIFLVDDNFIGNKKNVKIMLPKLIDWQREHGYPYWFYTEASINLADDDELLELMGDANFHSVFIGIETPSMESLRETHKYQNIHGDLLSKVHKVQKYGIEVMAGFIVGFDSDTEDIFDRQIEFITAARIPRAMIGPLQAMPNTELWTRLKREGRLRENFQGDTFGFCNFVTRLPAITLVRGYRKVLSTLYSPAGMFGRLYDLFDALDCSRNRTLCRLNLVTQLVWFFPILGGLIQLACADRDRAHYLRFMAWVWRHHRDKLLFAMDRAVAAHHFIRYTSDVMIPRLNRLEEQLQEQECLARLAG